MYNLKKFCCFIVVCSLLQFSLPAYQANAQSLSESEKQQLLEQISSLLKVVSQLQIQLKNLEKKDPQTTNDRNIENLKTNKVVNKKRKLFNHDHVLGYTNSKITILSYIDYQSPFVKAFDRTLEKIRINSGYDDDISIVYRHYPMEATFKGSTLIAEASECVSEHAGESAFWMFSQSVIRNSLDSVKLSDVIARAGIVSGLHSLKVESCIRTHKGKDEVNRDIKRAARLGIQDVPHSIIYLNGYEVDKIEGNVSYEEMIKKIDSHLGITRTKAKNTSVESLCRQHCPPSFAPEYQPIVKQVGTGKAKLIDNNERALFTLEFSVKAPDTASVYIPYHYIPRKGGISISGKRVHGVTVNNTRTQESVSVLSSDNTSLYGNRHGSFLEVEAGQEATITVQLKFRPAYSGEYYADLWNLTYFIKDNGVFYDITNYKAKEEDLIKTKSIYINGPEYKNSEKG